MAFLIYCSCYSESGQYVKVNQILCELTLGLVYGRVSLK